MEEAVVRCNLLYGCLVRIYNFQEHGIMRHVIHCLIVSIFFLGCTSAIAQKNQEVMTNSDVLKMVQSGTPEAAVIKAIIASTPQFDLSHEAVASLMQQKVSEAVVSAMIRRQTLARLAEEKAKVKSRRSAAVDTGAKWEIELHGGILYTSQISGSATPPSAETYSLAGSGANGYWSKRVSSWYFGDGAQLLGLSSSLDSILTKPVMDSQGLMFGVRASRRLTRWMAAEISLDRSDRPAISDSVLTQIESASASFKKAWSRLDVPGNTPSDSVSTVSAKGKSQTFATGAVVISYPGAHRISPYATVGIGMLWEGSRPSASLFGSYGGPSAEETDSVRLNFSQEKNRVLAEVVGGGVKVYINRHWGVRVDARAYLYDNPFVTLLTANHTNTPNAAWIVKATDASGSSVSFLQKLSGPGVSSYSSLSGPPISGLKTYYETGVQRRFPITVGLFWRF
jgi:hypothetical protein